MFLNNIKIIKVGLLKMLTHVQNVLSISTVKIVLIIKNASK